MVPINNHEDDGRSSSSSTCLPDGFHGGDAEETGVGYRMMIKISKSPVHPYLHVLVSLVAEMMPTTMVLVRITRMYVTADIYETCV